jgi:hypothetical protein
LTIKEVRAHERLKVVKELLSEQIDRAEKMLDEINEDMMVAEEHLKGMEKCCGLFILPWKK